MANDEENHALVADEEAFTEFALMAKTSAKSEVFDNSLCFKAWLAQVEARLAEHRNQEVKYCEKIRVLEFKTESRANFIEKFADDTVTDYSRHAPTIESSSNDAQNRNPFVTKTEASPSTISPKPFIKFVKATDRSTETNTAKVETAKPAVKYADLSWTRLLEFADDTVTDYSRLAPTIESSPNDAQNRNPFDSETEVSPNTISPKPFIMFVKVTHRSTETKTTKVETAKPTIKYAAMYSKPSKTFKVKGNQRNWNNLKSHQSGANFVMKKKACYNCGDFDHLVYDCYKWEKMGHQDHRIILIR
nr:ubiquitin hydrolase [Tanacetum cinerariifolium]